MARFVDWLRARHILGFSPTPERVPPANHARQTDELAGIATDLDAMEDTVAKLTGKHGLPARDAKVVEVIAAQGRVIDAVAGRERRQFDADLRAAQEREGTP